MMNFQLHVACTWHFLSTSLVHDISGVEPSCVTSKPNKHLLQLSRFFTCWWIISMAQSTKSLTALNFFLLENICCL